MRIIADLDDGVMPITVMQPAGGLSAVTDGNRCDCGHSIIRQFSSMNRAGLSILSITLFCISCSSPAIDASSSLVGAKEIPAAAALSMERIYIFRSGGGERGNNYLQYEWSADDALTVTHQLVEHRTLKSIIVGQEALRVPPAIARSARNLLWRVRPESESPSEAFDRDSRPIGCIRKGPHDFAEVSVTFHDEGSKSGTSDDRMAIFNLPYNSSCRTPASVEAREIIWKVIGLFPTSKVAEFYEKSAT